MIDLNNYIVKLPKLESEMTEKDWFEFRNNLDPDVMGFEEKEGLQFDEFNPINVYNDLVLSTGKFNIIDNLTIRNFTDCNKLSRIKYIVIHYTANNGDTAQGNTNYFKSVYRGASAHYFVDETYIYRCVKDEDISWHCGGGLQGQNGHTFYKICTNSNSIGIEVCSRKYSNGTYYFKQETINNCVKLVKLLMNKYNIPVQNVIRHYDVTGKICPAPFINDTWNDFKNSLIKNEEINKHWAQGYLDLLISKSIITNKIIWEDFEGTLTKSLVVALLDKMTGGIWKSNEANESIHWAQPHVISLSGKKIITDVKYWIKALETNLTKGLLLSLVCNYLGGVSELYKNRIPDHWARNCLDTLCDKGIIDTPSSWTNFESEVNKGQTMALLCKALYK